MHSHGAQVPLLLDAEAVVAVHAHGLAEGLVCFLQIAPAIPSCISALAGEQGILMRVIKNPTQPGFNHYLFESVAALVKQGCAKDAGMVDKLEEMLVPPFNYVLSQDVQVKLYEYLGSQVYCMAYTWSLLHNSCCTVLGAVTQP